MDKPKLSCHNCGLEAVDDCETEGKHIPATPDKPPCRFCERNREADGEVFDFHSETWVLEQVSYGMFEATIEDPNKHEQLLLNVAHHCQVVYKV